jgi:acyl CoA:acetate/3-ketoacid CoA transferase beta subunit
VTADGLVLREIAPGVSIGDVRAATGAALSVPSEPVVMAVPDGI